MGYPGGEFSPVCHLESDVIKTGTPWVKGIATAARVVAEAQKEAALLMKQQDPRDPGITRRDLELLDPSTRSYQSALSLMSRTVSAICSARLKLGNAASMRIGLHAYCPILADAVLEVAGPLPERRLGARLALGS